MNTLSMFKQAQKAKLSAIELVAHCAWCLVAQSGRAPMTVGQIQKHVALTSGIKPSAYQVRTLMASWSLIGTAYQTTIRQNAVATVYGYTGGEMAVLTLATLTHVFAKDDTLYNAIHTAVWPVINAAIGVSNSIYNFNQETDARAEATE